MWVSWNIREGWGCPWAGRSSCLVFSGCHPKSLFSFSLQMRPQKHKEKMLQHIQAAGPLPHSHPSPWRPCLQALGPPTWAVSAGRSHPELGADAAGITTPLSPRLGLWVWTGTVALDRPCLGLCHPWVSLRSHREQGREKKRSIPCVCTHPTVEAAGAVCRVSTRHRVL